MIHFLDALNEQATWSGLDDARNWGSKVLSQNLVDCNDELLTLNSDLNFIRQQLSMLHFQERLNVDELDERLSSIQLRFVLGDGMIEADSQIGSQNELPALRAGVIGGSQNALVKCLRNTLLVQFAHFLSDALAAGPEKAIARCEGLYRKELSKNYKTRAQLLADERDKQGPIEQRWRGELAMLAECAEDMRSDLIRGEDFFVPAKAAKFCSDACRFNTFQIKKQISNPDYLADKQRRYRSRKSKT